MSLGDIVTRCQAHHQMTWQSKISWFIGLLTILCHTGTIETTSVLEPNFVDILFDLIHCLQSEWLSRRFPAMRKLLPSAVLCIAYCISVLGESEGVQGYTRAHLKRPILTAVTEQRNVTSNSRLHVLDLNSHWAINSIYTVYIGCIYEDKPSHTIII